ncbi:molybdate ABC transporter substrate-binding protein [Cedecea sp. NFIX57]|uniref:molybdate ABC transporter substrate-binding protein n=1 Tax=Cedecea sp. NFIX57 TaxID=1566286 RepID=UPI000A0B27D4|nr:molybdate ABC transporter substrate-binding protein [Cedecea sp. NFIX57]SMG45267.1 molybdate transport system substrate-binding protein [Cedecea sp. NFIX57]
MSLQILAAGSLRRVWQPLMATFEQETGLLTETQFGPAGLLRARIEAGENCSLFASANMAHPHTLLEQGKARAVQRFAGNALCLTAAAYCVEEQSTWLTLLSNPALRIGTSTPGSDPSGDYTWQFFARFEAEFGIALQPRALALVGGPDTQAVPDGRLAAQWLIASGQADLMIGYRSYSAALKAHRELRVFEIPTPYNIQADYGLAVCDERAEPLRAFLVSDAARQILRDYGFVV